MVRTFPQADIHGQSSQWNDCIRPVSVAECAAIVLTCGISCSLQGDVC